MFHPHVVVETYPTTIETLCVYIWRAAPGFNQSKTRRLSLETQSDGPMSPLSNSNPHRAPKIPGRLPRERSEPGFPRVAWDRLLQAPLPVLNRNCLLFERLLRISLDLCSLAQFIRRILELPYHVPIRSGQGIGFPAHDSGTPRGLRYIQSSIIGKSKVSMVNPMERLFSEGIWNPERMAGFSLLATFLIPVLMLVVFALRGELSDVFSQISGSGRNPFVRNVSLAGWISASLLSLVGYNLVAVLLQRAGEQLLSSVALTTMIFTSVLLAVEATTHLAFGTWAADEFIRTGHEPALYSVFFEWSSVILQRVYVSVGYISLMLFGWSILRTAWLPAWAGWMCALWGAVMLGILLLSHTTLPATLYIPGAVLGMLLLGRG